MAWRIVKQPNGKLARFSDIVDNFTHYDMDREEAVELCREYMGRAEAEEKVERGEADDALTRWQEALQTIALIHGEEERDKIIKLIGA